MTLNSQRQKTHFGLTTAYFQEEIIEIEKFAKKKKLKTAKN